MIRGNIMSNVDLDVWMPFDLDATKASYRKPFIFG